MDKTDNRNLGCNQVIGRHTFKVRHGNLAPTDRCVCGRMSFRNTPEWIAHEARLLKGGKR